jgi:hypothetical protein
VKEIAGKKILTNKLVPSQHTRFEYGAKELIQRDSILDSSLLK